MTPLELAISELSSRRVLSSVPQARTTTRALTDISRRGEAVDEVGFVDQAGVLIDGELAHDDIGDGAEFAGGEGVGQKEIDAAGEAVDALGAAWLCRRGRLFAYPHRRSAAMQPVHGESSGTKLPSGY